MEVYISIHMSITERIRREHYMSMLGVRLGLELVLHVGLRIIMI